MTNNNGRYSVLPPNGEKITDKYFDDHEEELVYHMSRPSSMKDDFPTISAVLEAARELELRKSVSLPDYTNKEN